MGKVVQIDADADDFANVLGGLRKEAINGEIGGLALCVVYKDGSTGTYVCRERHPFVLLGAIEELKHRLLTEGMEQRG